MSQPKKEPGAAASPLKLALAAVLVVTFIVVLFVQFGGTSSAEQAVQQKDAGQDRASAPKAQRPTRKPQKSKKATTTQHTSSRWPILNLAEVLKYDPFATPAAFTNQQNPTDTPPESQCQEKAAGSSEELIRKKAEQEQVLGKLRQEGVTIVVGSGNDRIAVVGSQTIQVGELLNGFRVIAIEPDGVVLEQPETKPGIK